MFNYFSDHIMKYIVVPYEMHNILKLICCGQAVANMQIFEITGLISYCNEGTKGAITIKGE